MRETRLYAAVLAAALATVAAPAVWADSAPPPFLADRPFLEIIEKADSSCGQAVFHKPATGPDAEALTKLGLEAFVVECLNRKNYLVGRRPLDSDGKPMSAEAPVVREIPAASKKSG
ncbi:MAG TPA: hypothetical protein VK432_05360 [Stellaceae bacterium]|nr:hypothetical protein [Stellaceae bacterium]